MRIQENSRGKSTTAAVWPRHRFLRATERRTAPSHLAAASAGTQRGGTDTKRYLTRLTPLTCLIFRVPLELICGVASVVGFFFFNWLYYF